MSRLLLLLFTYLVVCGEASPAFKRLYFGFNEDEPGLGINTLNQPLTFQHNGHHRSSRFVFPDSGPAPPSPKSATRIFFPGEPAPPRSVSTEKPASSDEGKEGPGDVSSNVTSFGDVWFPGENYTTTIEEVSSCGVGDDLKYTYEGRTWKLLSRDECLEGEWVVMVADCQPGCKPIPCPPGQLEHEGQCVNATDPTVCDGGKVLYIDQTGSTFCDCQNDHFYYPWDGWCYVRQEQGPCDFGFFLDLNEHGKVECMPNACQVDEYMMDPTTGKCLLKNFVGFCPKRRRVFNETLQIVECVVVDIRNIFDRAITRSCSAGSGLDHFGNCRPNFVVPSVTAMPRSLNAGCLPGAISIGGGPCRRLNNYIG